MNETAFHAGDVWIGRHLMVNGRTAGQAKMHLATGFGLIVLIIKGNTCICPPAPITCAVVDGLGGTCVSAA